MSRQRRLNVYNSDKMFNLSFLPKSEDNYTLVTSDSAEEIKQHLKEHASEQDEFLKERDDVSYLIEDTEDRDDELVQLLFEYGGHVTYLAHSMIPAPVIELLARNRRYATPAYRFKDDYTVLEAENVQQVSAGAKVTVRVDVTHLITPFDVMSAMADLMFSVDTVEFRFLSGEDWTPEEKYDFFNEIRDALSGWKMGIVFVTENEEEQEYLEKRKADDSAKRKGSRVWE